MSTPTKLEEDDTEDNTNSGIQGIQSPIEKLGLNSGSEGELSTRSSCPSSPSIRDDPLRNVRPSKTSRWVERVTGVRVVPPCDTPNTPADKTLKQSIEDLLAASADSPVDVPGPSTGLRATFSSNTASTSSNNSLRSLLKPLLRDCANSKTATVDLQSYQSPMASNNPVPDLQDYLTANRRWARRMKNADPNFFTKLSQQQSPQVLWIGCSDSRVPANMIIDLAPGEVFVHRNVGNIFLHTDFNALSVLQYAVDVLKVKHIIVCGHYGCGAVTCAVENQQVGLIDNWLRHIKDLYELHRERLEHVQQNPPSSGDLLTAFADQEQQETARRNLGKKALCDLLCEINVARSLQNVCHTTIVQNAWARGQQLSVHAWCYRLTDGIIRDLDISANSVHEIQRIYQMIESKSRAEK